MALLRTKLADIQYVSATAGAIYTNPAASKTFIKGLIVHNTSAAAEQVQVYLVPAVAGALGSATAANRMFSLSLAVNETVILSVPFAMVLTDTNESVQAVATTVDKVTVLLCGDRDA